MAEPDGHGGEAGAGDEARGDEAQASPARQHERGERHAQCGRGLGELGVGRGQIEAERLRAMEIGERQERGALGIEQRAQSGGKWNDLCGRDDEKEKREGQRGAGAEFASAASGQPRGRERQQRGDGDG